MTLCITAAAMPIVSKFSLLIQPFPTCEPANELAALLE
jgi:hypothetical protein